VKRLKCPQYRQQGLRRGGLDDEPGTFFAHDSVVAGKLELARDAHRAIASVLEDFDVALGIHVGIVWHMLKHMPYWEICLYSTEEVIHRTGLCFTGQFYS